MRTTLSSTHRGAWTAPGSRVGMASLVLAAVALAGVVLLVIAFAAGLESADSFSDNWLLTGSGVVILLSGLASGAAGAVAVTREHDHSWWVVTASALGTLTAVLMLLEASQIT